MNKNQLSLIFMILLLIIFIIFMVSTDKEFIFTTGRKPLTAQIQNPYPTPILISPSKVQILSDDRFVTDNYINSPTRSFRAGTDYNVPTGNFSTVHRISPKKNQFIFNENGRKFGSIPEKICCKIAEKYIYEQGLNKEVKVGFRPDWMNPNYDGESTIDRRRNLELDIYIKNNKNRDDNSGFAIEYNGEQHYNTSKNFQVDNDKLKEQKKRDEDKIKLCEKNNVKLIVVPYYVDTMQRGFDGKMRYIKRTLDEREEKLSNYIVPFMDEYYKQ
jgi:hypothetical protein